MTGYIIIAGCCPAASAFWLKAAAFIILAFCMAAWASIFAQLPRWTLSPTQIFARDIVAAMES